MRRRIDERFLQKWADAIAGTIGTDEGKLDRWMAVLDLLNRIRKIRPARSFALDGRYSLEDKKAFFRNVLAETLGPDLPGNEELVLEPLLKGNLWEGIPALEATLLSVFDQKAGRVVVEVRSPAPLPPEIQAKISETLLRFVNEGPGRELTGAKSPDQRLSVKPVWKVRPELLAGLEIRIGSRVWDASLSARLRELEHQLLKTA